MHSFQSVTRHLSIIRQLFLILWQANALLFVLLLVLSLVTGAIPALTLIVNAKLIDEIVSFAFQQRSASSTSFPFPILILLFILAGSGALNQVMASTRTTIETLYRKQVTNLISLKIAEKASSLDLSFFENPVLSNRLTLALNEASYRPITIVTLLLTLLTTSITLISVTVIIARWHFWILLLVISISFLHYWIIARMGQDRVSLTLRQTPAMRKTQYISSLLTTDFYAKEIRLFNLRDYFLKRYRRLQNEVYQQDRQLLRKHLFLTMIVEPLLSLVRPALLAFVIWQAVQRLVTLGSFTLYTQAIGQLDGGFSALILTSAQLYENTLFLTNLFDFLALSPTVEPVQDVTTSNPSTLSAPSIEFRDVSFAYPDSATPVLNHLNFFIKPGEIIALVGENGAGKTTVVKLLAGLYKPTQGQILLDGKDIETLNRAELRSYLSVIFQDYAVYHLEVLENIGVGSVSEIENQYQIEQAAYKSGFAPIVEALPEKYQTLLGRWIERGHEFSGGQRQLLALSRVMMRKAPVLVLDEPGAALDILREQQFFKNLLEEQKEKRQTIIFISHHFSTVRRADHIVLLEQGTVIEQGSHEQLMAQQGQYANLFQLQSQEYASMEEIRRDEDAVFEEEKEHTNRMKSTKHFTEIDV
ncbi:HlyB/MsbA family ABC transporter [Dictyobacter alpinus]|uniref:HlyB/MsbA family ABC transporter n=1 Tax=Dictyobacter alpinus TaxID=2014873 RepID=A0A402BDT5_9CHLR|nr:ABC transporter ATP-binding protein [Dictyobacter alpinus]GCE29452.1 HlyB/MsbA family ABC transporter [Dictyobacter alpinus]